MFWKLSHKTYKKRINIPSVTYELNDIIRNKILNYKDTVNSIFVDMKVLFDLDLDTCECEDSLVIHIMEI